MIFLFLCRYIFINLFFRAYFCSLRLLNWIFIVFRTFLRRDWSGLLFSRSIIIWSAGLFSYILSCADFLYSSRFLIIKYILLLFWFKGCLHLFFEFYYFRALNFLLSFMTLFNRWSQLNIYKLLWLDLCFCMNWRFLFTVILLI